MYLFTISVPRPIDKGALTLIVDALAQGWRPATRRVDSTQILAPFLAEQLIYTDENTNLIVAVDLSFAQWNSKEFAVRQVLLSLALFEKY